MSDTEYLFDAAQKGDQDAFNRLAEQFRPRLVGFCLSRLGDGLRKWVAVEDVIQETTLKAFQSIGRLQWKGENALFSWFCGIALNVIYAHSQRFLRVGDLPQEHEVPDEIGTSPSRNARREERFDRLERSMAKLTEDQQRVLRLTRIEGRTVREAAVCMDRSLKATNQLLWRATKQLRELFGETASLHLPADRNLGQPNRHPND
ncbi:MAG: RNA polymerase sigma factor [Aeoliella sp.]